MIRSIAFLVVFWILLLAFAMTGFSEEPTTQPAVYRTPDDVFATFVKAGQDGEAVTVAGCLTPEVQGQYAGLFCTVLVGHASTQPSTNPSDSRQYDTLFAKYGVEHPSPQAAETPRQTGERVAAMIKEKPAFIADVLTMNYAHRDPNRPRPALPYLENISIDADGSTAAADVVKTSPTGTKSTQKIHFRKIDDSWRIDSMTFF